MFNIFFSFRHHHIYYNFITSAFSEQQFILSTLSFIKESNLQIINLENNTIFQFGQIKAELEKAGQRLEDFDLLIASTAMVNNFTLVTENKKHFRRIKKLKLLGS